MTSNGWSNTLVSQQFPGFNGNNNNNYTQNVFNTNGNGFITTPGFANGKIGATNGYGQINGNPFTVRFLSDIKLVLKIIFFNVNSRLVQ